jgi:hypothetical protein
MTIRTLAQQVEKLVLTMRLMLLGRCTVREPLAPSTSRAEQSEDVVGVEGMASRLLV